MNAERLIFHAAASARRAGELCANLWRNGGVKEIPKLDPQKCAQLTEAARLLGAAANALQLEASGGRGTAPCEPVRPSAIESAFTDLEKQLTDLGEVWSRCSQKITPIVSAWPATQPAKKGKARKK